MKKVLNVTKVAFSGRTGDDRSPEDLPFPACMTSLMEALGEDYGIITLNAHGRKYTRREGNHQFLAASGMAFGLLWHPEYCLSSMDVMQVNEHAETIRRAFAWAGYEYELIERTPENAGALREKIVRSIDEGVPVLTFGLIGPPECSIIAGYDEDGAVLIGWSHFQQFTPHDAEPNGMFRAPHWQDELWVAVLPGKKVGRSLTYMEALAHGREIMQKTQIDGYLAGEAAYDAWTGMLADLDGASEETLQARWTFHHHLLFNLAELRCWGGSFLHDADREEASGCFLQIHDLCWAVDRAVGGWEGLRDGEKRARAIELIREIKALDQRAANCLLP